MRPCLLDSAIVVRVCSLRFGVQRLDSPCGAPGASPTSPQAPELLDVRLSSQGSASLFAATHTLAYRENTSASIIQLEAFEMDEGQESGVTPVASLSCCKFAAA